jgi:biotin-(acetyl-CoA carboxylase) ligase
MARRGKSVYERIEDKREEIKSAEEVLRNLHEELKVLLQEKDELEMKQLLEQMKANNLDISQAINLLNKPTKTK